MAYTIESMNKLEESLNATGVLSKEYKSFVMGWMMSAVNEAAQQERDKQLLNLKQCPQCNSYSRSELYQGRFTPDNPCPHLFHRPLKNVPKEILDREIGIRNGVYIDRQEIT